MKTKQITGRVYQVVFTKINGETKTVLVEAHSIDYVNLWVDDSRLLNFYETFEVTFICSGWNPSTK